VLTVDKPRRPQTTATAAVKTRKKWLPFSSDSWEEKEAAGKRVCNRHQPLLLSLLCDVHYDRDDECQDKDLSEVQSFPGKPRRKVRIIEGSCSQR
jgi:hypothetical protein